MHVMNKDNFNFFPTKLHGYSTYTLRLKIEDIINLFDCKSLKFYTLAFSEKCLLESRSENNVT